MTEVISYIIYLLSLSALPATLVRLRSFPILKPVAPGPHVGLDPEIRQSGHQIETRISPSFPASSGITVKSDLALPSPPSPSFHVAYFRTLQHQKSVEQGPQVLPGDAFVYIKDAEMSFVPDLRNFPVVFG